MRRGWINWMEEDTSPHPQRQTGSQGKLGKYWDRYVVALGNFMDPKPFADLTRYVMLW